MKFTMPVDYQYIILLSHQIFLWKIEHFAIKNRGFIDYWLVNSLSTFCCRLRVVLDMLLYFHVPRLFPKITGNVNCYQQDAILQVYFCDLTFFKATILHAKTIQISTVKCIPYVFLTEEMKNIKVFCYVNLNAITNHNT